MFISMQLTVSWQYHGAGTALAKSLNYVAAGGVLYFSAPAWQPGGADGNAAAYARGAFLVYMNGMRGDNNSMATNSE